MAKGKGKKKAKGTSNVFSMFEQSQIQEFKEAFGMIDANRDGFIDKEVKISFGKTPDFWQRIDKIAWK